MTSSSERIHRRSTLRASDVFQVRACQSEVQLASFEIIFQNGQRVIVLTTIRFRIENTGQQIATQSRAKLTALFQIMDGQCQILSNAALETVGQICHSGVET